MKIEGRRWWIRVHRGCALGNDLVTAAMGILSVDRDRAQKEVQRLIDDGVLVGLQHPRVLVDDRSFYRFKVGFVIFIRFCSFNSCSG